MRIETWLYNFIIESNRIEGIDRDPSKTEYQAHTTFLAGDVGIEPLKVFVGAVAPGNSLRTEPGLNVRVGRHMAPEGGPQIGRALADLNARIVTGMIDAHDAYCAYEHLHPFTDGNGRSGRAIWLWMMERQIDRPHRELGFLQCFHYQTLEAHDRRVKRFDTSGDYDVQAQFRVK
jgi:hypothetical protein